MTPSPWALALGALRVAPLVALLPFAGLGVAAWPTRAAVAVALTVGVLVSPEAPGEGAWWVLCARELWVGAALAVVVALPWMALTHGAHLLAAQGDALEPVGRAARWAGAVAFVAARGHHGVLRALAASWAAVPPGAAPRGEGWLRAALDATAEALAGALVVASSGLLAGVTAALVTALAGRFAWPAGREGNETMRALAGLAAVALGLRAAAEAAVALGGRAHTLAAGMW